MRFEKHFAPVLATAIFCGGFATVSPGQQAPAPGVNAPAKDAKTPPLTEEALRSRYVGKMVFLRGFYQGEDLQFDEEGRVNGAPATASFTLSALEIRKVNLSKHKLEIEADRYGLHFFGALPYEDDSEQPYDKVKLSKKPIHITIQRELVVVPKVKKEKQKKKDKSVAAQGSKAPGSPGIGSPGIGSPGTGLPGAPAQTAAAVAPAAPPFIPPPGTTTDPAHSAMLMNKALDSVFALNIDDRMLAHLPDYWREYFNSKNQHRMFMPDHVQTVSAGITPPRLLNSIDPSSNEYAQKYGIAGLTLFRTVVDASGKPQQIAIARPIGFGLDEKAVEAIKASHFTPAVANNGNAVPVVIDVVVTFRIFSNRTKPGSVPKGSKSTGVVASAWDGETSKHSSKALQ
jgi:Gram-negative bacterial TonB protein C-terminal